MDPRALAFPALSQPYPSLSPIDAPDPSESLSIYEGLAAQKSEREFCKDLPLPRQRAWGTASDAGRIGAMNTNRTDATTPVPDTTIPSDWLSEFDAAAKRPLETRFRYAFIRTYKPVMDDAPFRAFDTTADYRRWCEENLPDWLGYGRV